MNDELDVMRRLVDYHDHIAAPLVPVGDDLQRGRRRVRRNRGLLVGGTVLGLASAAVAVFLVTGGGPAERPQPVGPPSPTSTFSPVPGNPGLTAPLVAPESVLDVQEFGFHLEGLSTLGGRLLPDHQELEAVVANATFGAEVYYQGRGPGLLTVDYPRQEVSINGVPGTYVERFDSWSNRYLSYVVWEYAPDAWAAVRRGDDVRIPERKTQVLAIAEAIRPGGTAARVPFRVGTASAPLLQAERVAEVDVPGGTDFWFVSFQSGLHVSVGPAAGRSCDPASPYFLEAFTYRGYAGCLLGAAYDASHVGEVVLRVDGTSRKIHMQGARLDGYDIEDLKQLLAEIAVAPSDDPATWFDLRTALGG